MIKEESGCLNRVFCNPNHALVLKVTQNGSEILEIEKPFKCCCPAFLPCCQKEATIRKTNPPQEVGYLQQPFCGGFFSPVIDVYDKKGGEKVGKIEGPCCCIGGCCSNNFKLLDGKGLEHAKIKRDAKLNVTSTADRYELAFEHKSTTLDDKLRIIGTTLFLDYLFFEGETDCICILCTFPPQCWFKLWDFYCCGALVPLRVKCCYEEVAKAAAHAQTGI